MSISSISNKKYITKNLARILVGSVPFAVFFCSLSSFDSCYDARRFLQITVLIFIFILNLIGLNGRSFRFHIDLISFGVSVFFSAGFISVFNAHHENLLFSFDDWLLVFTSFLAIIDFSHALRFLDCDDFEDVAVFFGRAVVISSLVYVALSVMGWVLYTLGDVKVFSDLVPWGFANVRYWSQCATWLIPVIPLASLFSENRSRFWYALSLFAVIGFWWIAMSSAARGTVVAVVSGIAFIYVVFGWKARCWLKFQLAGGVGGFFFWLVLNVAIPSLLGLERNVLIRGGVSHRFELWHQALKMSLMHFPLGVGPLGWLDAGFHEVYGHPHNMYLLWAAEWGWLACVGLFLALIDFFRRVLVLRNKQVFFGRHRFIVISVLGSFFGALVHALVSSVFIAPGSMLLGTIVMALLLGSIARKNQLSETYVLVKQSRIVIFFRVLPAVLAVVLMVTSIVYYQSMNVNKAKFEQFFGINYAPRFWFDGLFPR